jgi:muramoyltetrapeptide carboxypeptidase
MDKTAAFRSWVRASRLTAGDRILVIAPSGPVPRAALEAGAAELRLLGLAPEWDESIFERRLFFAGTDERRRAEIERAFADPRAAGVICARGGGGASRLLPLSALDAWAERPRVFSGFSDITYLHQAFAKRGLVSFYGPMVAWDMARGDGAEGGYDGVLFRRLLLDGAPGGPLSPAGVEALRPGRAEGRLMGGCLSLLSACVGTEVSPAFDGAIVLLEDENESPNRVERFLTHLKQAGALRGAAGFVLGDFPGGGPKPGTTTTMREVLEDFFADFAGPVVWGFPFGHTVRPNLTMPLGTAARLDAGCGVLELIEPACV